MKFRSFLKFFFFKFKRLIKKPKYNLSLVPLSSDFGCRRGTAIDRVFMDDYFSRFDFSRCSPILEFPPRSFSHIPELLDTEIAVFDPNQLSLRGSVYLDLSPPYYSPSYKKGFYRLVIFTNVLNFLREPLPSLKVIKDLLCDDGRIIGSVSAFPQLSKFDRDRWGDYWRFTDQSLQFLLSEAGFTDIKISCYGGFFYSQAIMHGFSWEDLQESGLSLPPLEVLNTNIVDNLYPVTYCFSCHA